MTSLVSDPIGEQAPQVLPGSSSRLADHTTPLVRNEWYVAAMSDELDRTLRERWLLGAGVLLYRTTDGTAVALQNRCPHRSFPLSRGVLEGDNVVCGYHGLTFGPDGACVLIPSQDTIPKGVRARRFPVVERPPLVWIWMGDPDQADPTRIPDSSWLSDPDYGAVCGYLHVKSSYVRLHENVLDHTHFPFLHGVEVSDVDWSQAPFEVTQEGNSACITRVLKDHPVDPVFGRAIRNSGHRVTRTSTAWFKTPAVHWATETIEDLEGGVDERTEFHFQILHMFTPETATTTHYFWAVARDVAIQDALLEAGRRVTVATFEQDAEALELIEENWRREDGIREVSLTSDRVGLLMRQIIAQRALDEAAPA